MTLLNLPQAVDAHDQCSDWYAVPSDVYLDHRRVFWASAERRRDVQFVLDADAVLVHRVRAWRIVEALGARRHTTVVRRQRDLLGSVGMVLGAAALVAAIAIPFNDAGLVLGVALVLRGGLAILDTDGAGR